MKREDKAREYARWLISGENASGDHWEDFLMLTVPDRGNVQFAADGSAFLELTLQIPAGMLK